MAQSLAELSSQLRLLPDRKGPITLLRLCSPHVLWRDSERRPVAHPWLLYAELVQKDDARALEAAGEIRKIHLNR